MKTKLVPLALLIPAVVLAAPSDGPAPSPSPLSPQTTIERSTQQDPVKAAKAASALSNAKKEMHIKKRGKELGEGEYDSWTYTTGSQSCPSGYHLAGVTNDGLRGYCSDVGPGLTTIAEW